MTQDRKGSAHTPDDLDPAGFGLGLTEFGDDPSEMFAAPPRQTAHSAAAPAPVRAAAHRRDPNPMDADLPDLPDLPELPDPEPFGGAGGFDDMPHRPAARPSSAGRQDDDPGDWTSMTGGGSTAARAPGFGDDAEPDGDPSAEFSGFETARGVASLGDRGSEASLGFRREPTPEHPPKGSYRGEEQGFDDVVGNFGDEEDQPEPPKGSLYREDIQDPDEELEEADEDRSLSLDDEPGEEDAEADGDEAGPSVVDRLKRFALPVAAAAAIGGAGYVGWGFVSPMLGSGDVAPIQMAGPIVPKQPNASLPSFPPAAGAQQRPSLPGAAGTLPSLPGQQPVTVQPGSLPGAGLAQAPSPQPRQVGLPSAPGPGAAQTAGAGQWLPQAQPQTQPQAQASLLPSAGQPAPGLPSAATLPSAQPYLPAQGQMQPQLPNSPGPSPAPAPVGEAGRDGQKFGGGLNTRTPANGDVEARLASIAADLSAIRSRQDEVARSTRSDMDDIRTRIGDLERRVGDARRVQPAKPAPVEEAEAKPRRAERQARSIRRPEPRPVYRQEASADDGVPPLKPKVVQGFNLKGVSRGIASVEGRGGVVEVGVGQNIPGVGEVKAIRRYGNDWVVVVGKGVIVQQ
ncbi:hypothetical protein [Methylobacterium radiotolerans]|uniref:hypothetical protein n=1 Tax=Methylobacterium radiotolerans TaxID=31998 RepID=UPI0038CFAA15